MLLAFTCVCDRWWDVLVTDVPVCCCFFFFFLFTHLAVAWMHACACVGGLLCVLVCV